MINEPFGSTSPGRGAKALGQQEWHDLHSAVENINIGGQWFEFARSYPGQVDVPAESFFHRHVGYIDEDYTTAKIAIFREEEWYPYKDRLGVEQTQLDVVYTLSGGEYSVLNSSSYTNVKSVSFATVGEKAVTTPTTTGDPMIVGYQWHLEPTVTAVTFNDDKSEMYVTWKWQPATDFDSDSQASIECIDVEDGNTKYWSMWSEQGIDFSLTKEAQINAFLSPDSISLEDDTGKYPYIDMFAPVASYEWNVGETQLDRCVQLLFSQLVGGVTIGAGPDEGSSGLDHPFKSRIDPDNPTYVDVGYLRPTWKDWITIEDPDSDNDETIAFNAAESIELDTPGSASYYIYYDIYYDSTGGSWTASLEKSTTWPPTQDTPGSSGTATGNIILQLGYAEWDSGNSVYIWYQHMYECPTEVPCVPRGDFEAMYLDDGSVRIFSGTVDTFNNDTGTVAQKDFLLNANTDIWVQIISTKSSGDPVVTITGTLQNGTYPGFYDRQDATTHHFNYLIGVISNNEYIPKHKGRIHVDNTVLMPDLSENYCVNTDTPRMMAFEDNQVTSVGINTNDQLLDAEFLEVEVIGGGVQKIVESTVVEFYGLSQDDVFNTFDSMDTDTEDEITFVRKEVDYDFDYGLLQQLDLNSLTDAQITALGKWVGIEIGGQIYHKNSPVTSTGDTEHWYSTTVNVSGGGTIELFFDDKGHLWKYDTTTQPTVENYRYRHCSDHITYPDLIFSSQQANTVIDVDDQCYEEIGTTEADATSPTPTVSATYASCAACTSGQTQEQWKKCSDDTDAAVLDAGQTTHDYAWLCIGGVWVKAYNNNPTATAATNPSVLEQCDAVPAECADLIGLPGSDAFSNTGCDSEGTAGVRYGIRWTESKAGTSTIAITGGALVMTANANAGRPVKLVLNNANITGDFDLQVDMSGVLTTLAANQESASYLTVVIGGTQYDCGILNQQSGSNKGYYIAYPFPTVQTSGAMQSSATARIRRTGTTVTLTVGTLSQNVTNSGTLTTIELANAAFTGGTSFSDAVTYDNFIALDSVGGVPIRIDPTGVACT